MKPTVESTIEFIKQAHGDQLDRAGTPYWMHPVAVAELLPNDVSLDERLAALLHDVVEDTPVTLQKLRDMGYSEATVDMVELVSRPKDDRRTYIQWIDSIIRSGNIGAMRIKLADNVHNSDSPERPLPPDLKHLNRRYQQSRTTLEAALRRMLMEDKEVKQHFPHFKTLMHWITERQKIYVARASGKTAPWTKDILLQKYRFCNVYREQDKVTKWIGDNWRAPNAEDPDLWFAMLVSRYINEPDTLVLMGYPVPWKTPKFFKAVEQRKADGKNVFNPAYIISTGGRTVPKHIYLDEFFKDLYTRRKDLRPKAGMTLREFCTVLVTQPGIGTFMAGQVIADLKYAQMRDASDWHTFAISGPGSRRGMNRLLDWRPEQPWKEEKWFAMLSELQQQVNRKLPPTMEDIHGQDLQNCLCEFDKYMRVKSGEGKPKQKFNGR